MKDITETNRILTEDPVIDNTGCSYDPATDTKIYNCILSEDLSNISGYTEEGTKAKYIFTDHRWYYGKEISKLNFIPITSRSEEERKEICSKAGKARWEKERNRRSLNDIAKELLDRSMSGDDINEILGNSQHILGDDNTVGAVMMVKMIQTAMAGSFKAAEFVRDTAGYKPKNEVELNADIITDADRSLLSKIDKRLTG